MSKTQIQLFLRPRNTKKAQKTGIFSPLEDIALIFSTRTWHLYDAFSTVAHYHAF